MKADRKRLIRAAAAGILALFLAAGIIFVARDVAVNPPVSPALAEPPAAGSPMVTNEVATEKPAKEAKNDSSARKAKKKTPKQPRRPQQRDFLNEPVKSK